MKFTTKRQLLDYVRARLQSNIVRGTLFASAFFGAGILCAGVEHLHGASAASWVQAVGSILAIIAAVVVAYSQHQQSLHLVELEQRRVEKQKRLEAFEMQVFIDEVLKEVRSSLEALAKANYGAGETKAAMTVCAYAGATAYSQLEHMRAHIESGVRSARASQIMLDVTQKMHDLQSLGSAQLPRMNKWAGDRLRELANARELLAPMVGVSVY